MPREEVFGAGGGIRTHPPWGKQILSLPRLPASPRPHVGYLVVEVMVVPVGFEPTTLSNLETMPSISRVFYH